MVLESPVPLLNSQDEVVGYTCERLVRINQLGDAEVVFYFDMSVPDSVNEVQAGLDTVRQLVIQGVADVYGFTDQLACKESSSDDWLVQFSSLASQFTKVELFDTCRQLEAIVGENCGFYEGRLSAKVVPPMPDPSLPHVAEQIGSILDGINSGNSTLRVKYTGSPVVDPTQGGTGGRDELKPPTAIEKDPEPLPQPDGDNTITIVGGLLIAAFALGFIGVALVLWRRRQAYLDERDTQFALSKSDLQFAQAGPTNTESKSQDGDDGPRITLSMEEGGVATSQDCDMDETRQMSNIRTQHVQATNHRSPRHQQQDSMEFDFGNSFKDQLMGVHGRQTYSRPGYGMTSQGIPDTTSESDADSWAQTDGTIGSLELQLEPITAEV